MPISPPTFCLSFGSLGDIIAVLQLAWELRAALDESAGASAELRALVCDVDAFARALQDVQANLERRRRNLRPDVLNGIAAALSRCRGVLSTIQQRIERARSQTSTSGWHKYWGTAAWSILGGKKDVEPLRARLSEQLGIIQLYLSLSEANSQERVQEVIEAQDTTLQRIYTVVQDIQLRFDVGVPGFQFYDNVTGCYYPPLARTSLQRLLDVFDSLMPTCILGNTISILAKFGISEDDLRNPSVRYKQGRILINLLDYDRELLTSHYVYLFREAAFSEWQLLAARTNEGPYMNGVLKTLLERGHTVGADCNCPVACGTRYRDDINDIAWCREALKAYSEVVSLFFEHLRPAETEYGWISSLVTAFKHWPDPVHLRLIIPTILSRQPLSAGDMVDLISKAPKGRELAHPVDFTWDQHTLDFYAPGAALTESLVGHVLPFSDKSLSHTICLPDWAYITCSDDKDASGHHVLCLEMNLDEECDCSKCTERPGLALEANIPDNHEV